MTEHREEPQDEAAYSAVSVVVKWFNYKKGFGFVQGGESFEGDAFLHISVLQAAGHGDLAEGARLTCDLRRGERGLQVSTVHSLDEVPAAPAHSPQRPTSPAQAHTSAPTERIEATMKFFNQEKGFGFAVPDDGGPDVFISARLLQRLQIDSLRPAQHLALQVRQGPKGPVAEGLEILS